MNIVRFVYLTWSFIYLVNNLSGAPIPQQGSGLSTQSHRFISPKGERPVADGHLHYGDRQESERGHVNTDQGEISDAQLLEELQKKITNFHPQHPPFGRPIVIETGIKILNTPTINPQDMTLTLSMKVWQSWSDQRFYFNLPRPVQLPENFYDFIWNPKTVVMNANTIKLHSKYMTEDRFWLETSKGNIKHSLQLTTKTSCLLDLTDYPYDQQQCEIQFGSTLYNAGSVVYRWSQGNGSKPIEFSPEALTPSSEFRYEGYRLSNDSIETVNENEKFSVLKIKLFISRSSMFPFYSFILPFSLLAFLGFLPPFLGPEALIGRITFGATTFIGSLALLYRRPIGPTVVLPYLPAIDVYAGLNMLLTFASLVESCIVGAIMKKLIRKNKKPTSVRRGQERLESEVETIIHFSRPISVRLGHDRIKVSAVSRQERNYIQGSEESAGENEERIALMQLARRVDNVTKVLYAVVAGGSIIAIHFCYKAKKDSRVDFQGVETA